MIATHHLVPNATDSPLPVGEGLGAALSLSKRVRSNLTKRQIEVTILACGTGMIGELGNRLLKIDQQSKGL